MHEHTVFSVLNSTSVLCLWKICVWFIACKTYFMRNILARGPWNEAALNYASPLLLFHLPPQFHFSSTLTILQTLCGLFTLHFSVWYIIIFQFTLGFSVWFNVNKLNEEINASQTYFLRNCRSHNEQPNNRSSVGFVEVEVFFVDRFADGFFAGTFFMWIRWIWSLRFARRVKLILQWSHWKMRSFVCIRKWHRREFLPNVRLQMGHGILLSLQISHLWSISWNMHSASVGVLVS